MIAKLIKYDFNALKKPIGLTWIISLGVTILFSLGIHFLPPGLAVTSLLFSILVLVAASIILTIIQVIHYYRSMYGKTGYFTWSLPANNRELFWAKTIFNLSAILASSLLVCLCIALNVFALKSATYEGFSYAFEAIKQIEIPGTLLGISALYIIWESFIYVFSFQFIITAGNRSPFLDRLGKIGGPIIVGIILYIVMQILNLLSLLIPGILTINTRTNLSFSLIWESTFSGAAVGIMPESLPGQIAANASATIIGIPIWYVVLSILTLITLGVLTCRFYRRGTSLL